MFPTLTPITKNIIIINVIVYVISNFFMNYYLYDILSGFFPLSPNFHAWQIFTHMFMHAPIGQGIGITHILFNMLTLWSFGPILERSLGEKKYFLLYFLSGIGGFVLFNLWNSYEVNNLVHALSSQGINASEVFAKSKFKFVGESLVQHGYHVGNYSEELTASLKTPMVGASGAIFGVVAAFATLFSEAKLIFMFIPFPIKAKYLLPIIVVGSIYLGFSGNAGGIAHFAHVGGAIVGFLLAKYWKRNQYRIN